MGLLQILEKQEYKCALTGRPLTPDDAALDHIIPVSRGGPVKELSNLQVVHKIVNAAKNTMSNEEFISLCREVSIRSDLNASS